MLIFDVLAAYFLKAPLFVAAHGLLIWFIVKRTYLGAIKLEIRALREWSPLGGKKYEEAASGGARLSTSSTKVLDQFVDECRELSPQGFFVSLTEFSDRVDSEIEGMLTDLHNRINMLLIVGIAGSLYGLFEFANGGSFHLEGGAVNMREFSLLLSRSMAKAFPVGFVGLVLMLAFQVWASKPESLLRKAASRAIQNAVAKRTELSRSQAEIVQRSAEAIQESMKPLAHLDKTLENTIMPVVDRFGQEMERSHQYFQKQFDELTGATGKIDEAVKAVQENVNVLRLSSDRLEKALAGVPAVLQTTQNIQKQQESSLREFLNLSKSLQDHLGQSMQTFEEELRQLTADLAQDIMQVSQTAKRALEGLEDMPERISTEFVKSFDKAQDRADEITKKSMADIHGSFEEHLELFVGKASERFEESQKLAARLDTSIGNLDQVMEKFLGDMQSTANEAADNVVGKWEKMVDATSGRVAESQGLIERLEGSIGELDQVMKSFLVNTQNTANRIADEVVGKWRDVSEGFSGNLLTATDALEKLSKIPAESEEKIDKALEEIRQQTTEALTKTWSDFMGQAQASLLSKLEDMRKDAGEVREELKKAAAEWQNASHQTVVNLQDPINSAVNNASAKIMLTLDKFDLALTQKYPDVIRQAETFTRELEEMIKRLETASAKFTQAAENAASAETAIKRMPQVAEEKIASTLAVAMQKGERIRRQAARKANPNVEPNAFKNLWRKFFRR